jgi:hypothetical protein
MSITSSCRFPASTCALPTIYRRLEECGYRWKIYLRDLPQPATLADLWLKIPALFSLFDDFAEDARNGRLPN